MKHDQVGQRGEKARPSNLQPLTPAQKRADAADQRTKLRGETKPGRKAR